MAIFFLISYWLIIGIFATASIMIIYHIWTYYLNKKLALFTIAIFLIGDLFLFLTNFSLFFKVNWNFLELFF